MGTMRGGEKEKEVGTIVSKNGMSAERPPPQTVEDKIRHVMCPPITLKESKQETSDHSHPSSNLHPPT